MPPEPFTHENGMPCLRLANGDAELAVSVGRGPRVLTYRLRDGTNVFKRFDDQRADAPADEWFSYGGHRLWHAPEVWPRTYYPDNDPVDHAWNGRALTLSCARESTTGLRKEIRLILALNGSAVNVEHRIYNDNPWAVTFAPWTLSVMAAGGELYVPQEPFQPHGHGPGETFAHARTLALWPFTDMGDPRFTWGGRYIRMRQDDRYPTKLKFGASVNNGWAAYAMDDVIFVKRFFPPEPGATYPDGGCNAEFFTMPGFLEVEALGPLAPVEPGNYASLVETWTLLPRTGDSVEQTLEAAIP